MVCLPSPEKLVSSVPSGCSGQVVERRPRRSCLRLERHPVARRSRRSRSSACRRRRSSCRASRSGCSGQARSRRCRCRCRCRRPRRSCRRPGAPPRSPLSKRRRSRSSACRRRRSSCRASRSGCSGRARSRRGRCAPTATILPSGWRTVAAALAGTEAEVGRLLAVAGEASGRGPPARLAPALPRLRQAGGALPPASPGQPPAARSASARPAASPRSLLSPALWASGRTYHRSRGRSTSPPKAGTAPSVERGDERKPVGPEPLGLTGTRAVLVPVSAHIRAHRRTSAHIRCA